MIEGARISLRPVEDRDWPTFEGWGEGRDGLWGPFQRFQLDHIPLLRGTFQETGFLRRDSGVFLMETNADQRTIGFVRYTLVPLPDADLPYPEIGFGIPDRAARGKGYAKEAVGLLVDYLFAGYPVERIVAFTDVENAAAQRVLEQKAFQREGVLRRAMFRDGQWHDVAIYGLLRTDWGRDRAAG